MKRNSFLKFSLAAVASLTAPFVVMAKKIKDKRGDKVIKVVSGDDRFGKPSYLTGIPSTRRCLPLTQMGMYMYVSRQG
jgi:hypothetical protein